MNVLFVYQKREDSYNAEDQHESGIDYDFVRITFDIVLSLVSNCYYLKKIKPGAVHSYSNTADTTVLILAELCHFWTDISSSMWYTHTALQLIVDLMQ